MELVAFKLCFHITKKLNTETSDNGMHLIR